MKVPGAFKFRVRCLACGKQNDAATSMNGGPGRAKAGSFILCAYCAGVMRVEDAGPPPKVRMTTDADNEDMAEADVNRARQMLLDRLRFNESFSACDTDEALDTRLDTIPEGKVGVLGGIRCSDGPPPRRWRGRAEKVRCNWCRAWAWVNRREGRLLSLPVACVQCMTQLFLADGKRMV